MPNQVEYASRIIDALALLDSDLDTGSGTVPRKLIDAFAEVLAEASIDAYLLSYAHDVDTKSGAALDDLARMFAITRMPARRATGEVTLARHVATQELLIPIGMQLATSTNPAVLVATTVAASMAVDQTEITIPAQAIIAGAAGNLSAHMLNRNVTNITGITSFDNEVAFTGGVDAESDEHLRARIKRTALRNLAGTEAMYLGVALDDPDADQVNLIGAAKRHREQIELVAGQATSVIDHAAYVYEKSAVFGPSIDTGEVVRAGIHYAFDGSQNPPAVTSLDATVVPDGVYELEYDYLPLASRNQPQYGITNRIDLYVWGSREVVATETMVWKSQIVFSTDPDDEFYVGNFQRSDESSPDDGNFLLPYSFGPVMSPVVGGIITIGSTDYTEGEDFFLVQDTTPWGLSGRSYSGIEWVSFANGGPAQPDEDDPFTISYTFNEVPSAIASQLQLVRLVTTDVMVHQAKPIRLNFHFAVILSPGATAAQVEAEAGLVLTDLLGRVGFDGVLQTSDVLSAVHSVQGVDAVRFLTSADDAVDYGIQRVNDDGDVMEGFDDGGSPARAADVLMDADSIPVFNDITLDVRATNTLGSV